MNSVGRETRKHFPWRFCSISVSTKPVASSLDALNYCTFLGRTAVGKTEDLAGEFHLSSLSLFSKTQDTVFFHHPNASTHPEIPVLSTSTKL